MSNTPLQTVGLVGRTPVAALVARRLSDSCRVVALDALEGAEPVDSLAALGARTNLVLLAGDGLPAGLAAALSPGATVVDLMPGDPAHARRLAAEFAQRGIAFVDAPLHCEQLAVFPAEAAIFCGGAAAAVADVQPLLQRLGAQVLACGELGSGQVMYAIVAGIAACNRLISYECAAMGVQNGLTVADMATVLNRCSGANSATARVLPVLVAGSRTSDAPLATVAGELALCTQLARRAGAPALLAHQAAAQVLAASRTLGAEATLDDLRALVEQGSGIRFTA
ncbi:NAD(P)-binding domain-containing protein [Piscinibacter defluvii]|uniref:NAD(P)-binding domain-containing protein n=1 Tax=Piscinibacter defluvii TaxID=1796922 RepID=UPI000FDD85F4|nr:NAD(P)-binding domain-containing protein [Piscinibacter defluvii]